MVNTKFEAYKICRELKKSGKEYEFERANLNDFKEPTSAHSPVGKIVGLYHEQNGHISIVTGDTTQTRIKKVPMILCLYENVKSLKIQNGDIVKINSKNFKVTGIINIQEWNIIADISLEVIDDGVQD
jgi:hypothetical protein